jgi:1,4-dihydroxy-2-naphthoate octaprenyltransferase
VALGDERTRWLYTSLVYVAVAAVVVVAATTTWWALLALAFGGIAAPAVRTVVGGATGPALIPVLQQTGTADLVLGAGLFAGLLLGA